MTGEEIKEQVYDAVACDDMFYRPELRDAIYGMVDENEKLKLENAKLRELVQSLYRFSFDEYPDGTELNFADRLRKLGIEVEQ